MDYFYAPPANIRGEELVIDGDEFAHMTHVMRKKAGDDICVVDGKGNAYDVRLEFINKKIAHGRIVRAYARYHEPLLDVTLGVGVLKNPSKFDFLVEKVTELGVRQILPILTDRTIPSHAKVDRWQKLALAAMKQSGRSYLPVVRELMTLDELLTQRDLFDRKLIAHEEERSERPPATTGGGNRVLILVGPEGGFTNAEVERSIASGCEPVYLGALRLRTETAAVVMAARVLLP